MTGGHGTSEPAPDPEKCLEPDSGGIGFGGPDSGLTWASTVIPGGAGLQAFGTFVGASTLSLTTLPAFDDSGNVDLGFLSSVPDFLEFVTQPDTQTAWVSRGQIRITQTATALPAGEGEGGVLGKDWKPAGKVIWGTNFLVPAPGSEHAKDPPDQLT